MTTTDVATETVLTDTKISLVETKKPAEQTSTSINPQLKMERNIPFLCNLKTFNIFIIGCGGTGSHIIPHLARLIAALPDKTTYRLTFVDGDIVEEKNLARQHFIQSDVGKNKAEALAGRYSAAFGLPISFREKYIESASDLQNMLQAHKSPPLIISCVDNVKTRALIKDVVDSQQYPVYWIDTGNEDMAGQVVLSARIPSFKIATMATSGIFPLPDVFDLYPDLWTKLKTDKFASELSCAEMAVSSPQHGFVNLTAATLALNFIFPLLTCQKIYSHVVEFNIKNKYAHRPLNISTINGWKTRSPIWAGVDTSQIK